MKQVSISVFVHRHSVLTHVSFHNSGETAIRYTLNGLDAFSTVIDRLQFGSESLRDFAELRVATHMKQPFSSFPYPAFTEIVIGADWNEDCTITNPHVTMFRAALGDGAFDLTHAFSKLPEKTMLQVLTNLATFVRTNSGAEFVDSIKTLRAAFGAKICND